MCLINTMKNKPVTVSSSNGNKKKATTQKRVKEDRLTDLPESVLHHILSFLDMKEVLQSSFFSKRWRYLWTSVPVLNFDYNLWSKHNVVRPYVKMVIRKSECMDFVDRVLFSRDNFASIRKINLSYAGCWDLNRVKSWLICAVKRHVKEVSIKIHSPSEKGNLILPELFFTSEIEVLNLRSNYQLPESMCSSLRIKTLFLCGTRLPKGGPNGILTLNYPVLEELIISCCKFGDLKVVDASSDRLKRFVLRWPDNSVQIRLCAPNLKSFEGTDCSSVRFSLENLSSVVTATLDTTNPSLLIQFLSGMCDIRSLRLSRGSKVPPESIIMWDHLFTAVPNLRSIELIKLGSASCIRALKSAPNIEHIVLDDVKDEDCDLDLSSEHVFHHLKCIKVRAFHRSLNGPKFFTYLLKNAVMLQYFIASPNLYEDSLRADNQAYWKTIQSLPRSSSKAKLQFNEIYYRGS